MGNVQTFLWPTMMLVGLIVALIFAVRFVRRSSLRAGHLADSSSSAPSEQAFMALAMQEAVARLRDNEQAQQARADESERLSDDIITGLSAGLLVISAQGQARVANPAARRLLDLPARALPIDCSTLLSSVPPVAIVVAEALQTRAAIVRRAVDLRPLTLSSGASHVDVTISPVSRRDGAFDGVICLLNDLSTVIQLEEQLRLRESLAQVGEMTAGIAHEFRNSLATIHGYARLIDTSALPERDRACVEGIGLETTMLGEVLTNFLHFARPVELARDRVDVRALLERSVEEARADVRAVGGQLTFIAPPAALVSSAARGHDSAGAVAADEETGTIVEGDEVLLRQAFSNVCRNAIEASDDREPPVITIELLVFPERRELLVRVRDNGPGVDPAVRDRIFQPFFTTKSSGTGLGLSLVQKIIVTHNGRITPVHPATGGLCMEISLPLAESATLASSPR